MLILEFNGQKDLNRWKFFIGAKFLVDSDTNISFEMARMYMYNRMSNYDNTSNTRLFSHLYATAPAPVD